MDVAMVTPSRHDIRINFQSLQDNIETSHLVSQRLHVSQDISTLLRKDSGNSVTASIRIVNLTHRRRINTYRRLP